MSNDEAVKELADMVYARDAYERTGTIWFDEQIALFLERNIVIHRAGNAGYVITEMTVGDSPAVATGTGPEHAIANLESNPNWLRNKALNYLRLADYIENREEVAANAARDRRRDELAREFADDGAYAYRFAGEPLKLAIDRILEIEACE